MEKFWMLLVQDRSTPVVRYESEEAARQDAHRLCEKMGQPVYLLEALACLSRGEPTWDDEHA